MEGIASGSVSQQRFRALILGLFGIVALSLAAIGIYGVMSYSVGQRTHEIGIRMSLGVCRGDVLRLVVGQGLVLTSIRVVIGLAAAVGLTRVMSSLLYQVSATDPAVFAGMTLILALAACAASYISSTEGSKSGPDDCIAMRICLRRRSRSAAAYGAT